MLFICVLLVVVVQLQVGCNAKLAVLSNTALPKDNNNHTLLTGEADVLEFKGTYYLYMNNWGGCQGVDCCTSSGGCSSCCFNPPSAKYPDACVYTDNHTVLVYSTTDFIQFNYLGIALDVGEYINGIEFRPHVVYNAHSQQFVMWYEDRWAGKTNPGYTVAVSPVPQGPFKTVEDSVVLGGTGRVGDYDVFVDDDGTAYHVRTGLIIAQLNANYTAGTGLIYSLPNSGVEGPAMFKRNSTYYVLVGVGCCACIGGSNVVVYTSKAPLGPYTLFGDVGTNHSQSFDKSSPYNYITHAQGSAVCTSIPSKH